MVGVLIPLTIGCELSEVFAIGARSVNNDGKIVIRFAHHLSDTHSLGQEVHKFKEVVEKKSNGRIKVKIYSGGQLGDQRDLLEGLELGTVDMSLGDSGVVSNYYPKLGILDLPYVFEDMRHAKASMDGPLGEILKKGLSDHTGFRTLGIEPLDYRSTILAKRKVRSLEDFSGIKLRTLQSPQIINTFKSFEVMPISMPTGEAISGMETGIVDGMESNPEFMQSIKIWEIAKYYVDTKHEMTFETINISDQFYNSLPDNMKKVINESVEETVDWFYDFSIKKGNEGRQALREHGVQFLEVDMKPFKEAARPTVEEFVETYGLEDWYQLILEAKGK